MSNSTESILVVRHRAQDATVIAIGDKANVAASFESVRTAADKSPAAVGLRALVLKGAVVVEVYDRHPLGWALMTRAGKWYERPLSDELIRSILPVGGRIA